MFPSARCARLRLFALDATDLASKLERNAERDREDVLRLARAGLIDPLHSERALLRGTAPLLTQQAPVA